MCSDPSPQCRISGEALPNNRSTTLTRSLFRFQCLFLRGRPPRHHRNEHHRNGRHEKQKLVTHPVVCGRRNRPCIGDRKPNRPHGASDAARHVEQPGHFPAHTCANHGRRCNRQSDADLLRKMSGEGQASRCQSARPSVDAMRKGAPCVSMDCPLTPSYKRPPSCEWKPGIRYLSQYVGFKGMSEQTEYIFKL